MQILRDRVALVTGSSRGIGAGIAQLFAAEGAKVAVHGRDRAAAERVCAAITDAGDTAHAVVGDVTRAADLAAMRADIEAALGTVDVLVVNAGGNPVPPMPIDELPEDGWRTALDLNLTGAFLTLKTFLPGMKQLGRGAIVTISSAAARRPTERSPAAYAAAKAGLELLTQSVAVQMGKHGIRANCVAPETILTERNQRMIPDAMKATLATTRPIQRLGTPDDVARAALFLAGDGAAWVTGITVDVAGGAVIPR
jgi:3-oxoacyl-[acyl-carrier protein] reductase